MKNLFLLSALMATFGLSMAQEVQTYSVYDANQSGTISVEDVTATVEQVKNDVAATSTQQYVTAEDLSTMFGTILSKLNSLESDIAVIKEKLGIEDPSARFNGHDYVDLGITDADGKPIYWATCNVGASSPEEYGDYFAWGATTGYTNYASDGHRFNWENAPFNGGDSEFSKTAWETAASSAVDTNNNLLPANDAATANWGGAWRMPTTSELEKGLLECYWEKVSSYNGATVSGYVVYKAKSDSDKGAFSINNPTLSATYSVASDAHIFLPAAGRRDNNNLEKLGSTGNYWSCTLETHPLSQPAYYRACTLFFDSTYDLGIGNDCRACGLTVRPVCQ